MKVLCPYFLLFGGARENVWQKVKKKIEFMGLLIPAITCAETLKRNVLEWLHWLSYIRDSKNVIHSAWLQLLWMNLLSGWSWGLVTLCLNL